MIKREIFYIAAIVVLAILAMIFLNRSRKLARENQNKDTIIAEKNDTIRYHKNDRGRIIAEKNLAQATASELAKAYPQIERELKEEFDIRMRDLKAYVRNEFQAQGQGEASVTNNYYIDSTGNKIKYRDFTFNDGYLDFKSLIIDSLDVADSKYTYSDTISFALHRRKKWFLGSEKLYASSMLRNPNARVTGATSVLVDTYKDKRFAIFIGGGYDPLNNRIVPTIGIGYTLIKF